MSVLVVNPSGALSVSIVEPDEALARAIEDGLRELPRHSETLDSEPLPLAVLGPSAPLSALRPALAQGPALVLAHRGDEARVLSAVRAGATDTAPWPLEPAELDLRLRALLDGYRTTADLEAAERDLETLLSLSESLVVTQDIERILFEICTRLAEAMHSDRCSVILLDEEEEMGLVLASSDDPKLNRHPIDLAAYPEIREVVRTSAPLVIWDAQRAPLLEPVRDKIRDKPVASITVFPVHVDRRVQGVLLLRERVVRTRSLHPRDVRLGRIIANSTAIAIRNARNYELIKDTSERRLSERLKAERRLKQIEKYQRFFDFAGDGLMIIDGTGRILLANRAARAILGFGAAAISQITLWDIVEARGRPALDDLMAGIREGLHSAYRDVEVVRASGETAILSLTTSALEDGGEGGQDAAVIASFRDVTATRKMQEELRTTKDFLANLIESSADAIVAADMQGRIVVFNKVAERITGYSAASALGARVEMLYPPGVAKDIMTELRASSGRVMDRRASVLDASGTLVPINLAVSLVLDEGREVATVGIFSDLRERLRMEERLLAAQQQLELGERQRAVVELAGGAAHELNQPLTSILGTAELGARRAPPGSAQAAALETIVAEAERMAEIVKKLGQITKYETKPYVGTSNILDLDAASRGRE